MSAPQSRSHDWQSRLLPGVELSHSHHWAFSDGRHVHLDYHLSLGRQGGQKFIHNGSSNYLQARRDERHSVEDLAARFWRNRFAFLRQLKKETGLPNEVALAIGLPPIDDRQQVPSFTIASSPLSSMLSPHTVIKVSPCSPVCF